MAFITYIVYSRVKEIEIKNSFEELIEISKSRINYISEYFSNMEKSALVFARTDDVVNAISSPREAISNETEELFRLYTKVNEIENFFLINVDGITHYSTSDKITEGSNLLLEKNKELLLSSAFSEVKYSLAPVVSRFDHEPGTDNSAVIIASPIFKNGEFIGVFAFQIQLTKIYNIIHNHSSLGKTGEVLVGVRKGDELFFVNSVRNGNKELLQYSIEFGSDKALPMQKALAKRSGSGISVDYRNYDVLAVWQYFPKLELGIVVKIDLDEALTEINNLGNLLFLISGVTLLFVMLFVIGVSKAISRPIEKLRRAIDEIEEGRLDTEIEVNSSDELGDLAEEFKNMLNKLRSSMTSVDRLNEEVEKNQNLLQSSEELISRVSHELRTPLIPILSGIQFALKSFVGEKDQEKKEILEIAERNVERLNALVDEMISYQKIRVEQLSDQKKTSCSINQLIKESMERKNRHIIRKKLLLNTLFDPNIPLVEVDAESIREVINSILDNAIKFTDQGSITIRSSLEAENIVVSIQDSGIGIKKEDLPKLFQGFREIKIEALEKKQGFGLSLAKCKAIIEAHGGRIWADSKRGEGSVFTFSLPKA
ncbi:MAG: hypothetical protein ChlgKO_07010 [Chlamydiales bacterium]